MKPVFFATPKEFRAWLDEHHATATELWMGLYKKGSGRPSITWPEAVDEALCFGWIDSVRQRIDDERYMNRFTPRKPTSNWSAVNIRRVEELTKQRRMRAAGLKAFRERREDGPRLYSYEQRHLAKLDAGAGAEVPGEEAGLGVVPGAAEGLPDHRRVLGGEREETGDEGATPRHADRGLEQRSACPTAATADGSAIARYRCERSPHSSGKNRLLSVERRYSTPDEPPVPDLAPISRSTMSTWW